MNIPLSRSFGSHWAITLLAALTLAGCGDTPPDAPDVIRPVKLMTINVSGTGATVEYPGVVSATESVELGFEVPGKIIELPISDGLQVKKGQLLGRLDPADYVAEKNAAKANYDAMQSAYARAKRIFDQGAGSQAEVDRALQKLRVARAELKKATKALDDTALKAPFAGTVARKLFDNFKNVQAKQPILVFQDISVLKLDVNIPERDIARAKTGMTPEEHTKRLRPEVAVSTLPGRTFPARLLSLETEAHTVTRTYRATFVFERPEGVNILPGMTARVILHLASEMMKDAGIRGFMIPAAATVVDSSGQPFVWRFDPVSKQVSRTPVTLGEMSEADVLVTGGLKSGDRIVIAGAAHLHEGMRVRPLTQ